MSKNLSLQKKQFKKFNLNKKFSKNKQKKICHFRKASQMQLFNKKLLPKKDKTNFKFPLTKKYSQTNFNLSYNKEVIKKINFTSKNKKYNSRFEFNTKPIPNEKNKQIFKSNLKKRQIDKKNKTNNFNFPTSNKKSFKPQKLKINILNQLDFNLIAKNEEFLFKFLEALFSHQDYYDVFKEYIDFMQDHNFEPFLQILTDLHIIDYKHSFILERATLMTCFYLLISNNLSKEVIFLQKLILAVYSNFYSYVFFIVDNFSEQKIVQKNIKIIEQITKRNIEQFNVKLSNDIKGNNQKIMKYIEIQMKIIEPSVFNAITKINEFIDDFSLNEGFNYLLKIFTGLFDQQGVSKQKSISPKKKPLDIETIVENSEKSSSLITQSCIEKEYTLVLDLDETLVHYKEQNGEGRVYFRPFVEKFLKIVSKNYEVMIFTASLKEYADPILNHLDPEGKIIQKRFYREDTLFVDNEYSLKDLTKLGRDLSKIIIIDNIAENFTKQIQNGIFINSWYDDESDTALMNLLPILNEIVKNKVDDVRDFLTDYKNKMIQKIKKGSLDPNQHLLSYQFQDQLQIQIIFQIQNVKIETRIIV